MEKFKLWNRITDWIVFLIASFVYLSTIEPTASFWDCGEFIAAAYKFQVGHPPGAPFFMLLGRLFTLFALGDVTKAALMANALSALASSFTILFLFWTISHLAKKITIKSEQDYNIPNLVIIIGSAMVGSLAYTFSDTFWFSATEGEVYALSSLFTAVVFWAILKWENIADQKYSNRWLILIAYLMGISIGVHLLNLLAIPAIVFVFYFRKYEVTRRGILIASGTSIVILGLMMYGIIPGIVRLATMFELLFVNVFRLPYKSGLYFYIVILTGAVIWGIHYTIKHNKVIANTALTMITVILIGYSSYAIIMIRSNANPPMDQNNPETLFSLLYYLNREQYGSSPLVTGNYYNAPVEAVEEGKPTYTQKDGKYIVTNNRPEYVYDERFTTFFPRMWSNSPQHIDEYKKWGKIKGTPVRVSRNRSEPEVLQRPTFGENLRFFFDYQVGFMYFRYFMWNFVGRQNDIQGFGEITNGNWISGIPFIDEARLGPQDNLPDFLKNNPARNKYYMLPLLLGLAGILYQYKKDKKDFTIVTLLFVFTGLAILLYLNQTPLQPRERDYAYAGSFYAFSVWIGLGVMALSSLISRKKHSTIVASGTVLITLGIPALMAAENWDDHDRSGRYTARDFAYNYLNSCAPNAILFTNGDNDTFPLWYAQDVEGIRTDVRVINMSYLGADWYIEQMSNKAYESEPVPFSMDFEKYIAGTRDVVYLIDRIKGPVELSKAIEFVASDNANTKRLPNVREDIAHFPSKEFQITIDSARIMQTNTLRPEYAGDMVNTMNWSINKEYIMKNELMVMDLLANNNWERPVYYAITVSSDNYLNLQKYFQIHGLAYRIVPVEGSSVQGQIGSIDTEIMYDNMMNKFKWGGVENPDVYLDENNRRMLSNFRNNFAQLAEALYEEGKRDSALLVLDRSVELMPHSRVPYNFFSMPVAETYFRLNETEKALDVVGKLREQYVDELNYYLSLPGEYAGDFDYEIRLAFHIMQELRRITNQYGQADLSNKIDEELRQLMMMAQGILQGR